MKILFIQKVKALAGSEKYFLELIPALEKKGITIEFACIYNHFDKDKAGVFIDEYQKKGLKLHCLEVKSDRSILKALRFIHKIIKRNDFDLIHTHLIHADLWAALLKRMGNITCPIVSTKHGYDENYIANHGFDGFKVPKNLYYRLCRFSEKKIAASFAVSDGLRQLFINSGISKPGQIKTIYHGFDLPQLTQEPDAKFRLAPLQIIILGRIIPFKGHAMAIKALGNIKADIGDFNLVIVGHGDDDLIHQLKRDTKSMGMEDRVVFTGFQSNINDYLHNSDIILVPSIAEGFGLVFLEAMNAKLPAIGFDVPATNEIVVHQETGLLVRPYDIEQFGKAINTLAKDEHLRKAMGEAANNRLVSYFCLDRMVNETVNFYKEALADQHE